MQTGKGQVSAGNQKAQKKDTDKNASENVAGAHEEAIHDIEQDPDFSVHSANDDLDEGETARLGEDRSDIV